MTAPPLLAPDAKHYRSQTTLTMRGAQDGLPAGVCGQVEGIAMVYGVVDTYGTTFSKGCLDRTCRERVAAGKVRLFLDHGDVPANGMYDTHLHIGTVREVTDVQGPDGKWQARFRADLFDTASGRAAHEYLKAVAATGSETGVSIGMLKEPATTRCMVDGQEAYRIDEVALGEISVTSMSSVPGTRVTAVRMGGMGTQPTHDMPMAGMNKVLASLDAAIKRHQGHMDGSEPDTPASEQAEMDDLMAAREALMMCMQPDQMSSMTKAASTATLSTAIDYFVLLDGITAHVGLDAVRAHVGATVGNASPADTNAATATDAAGAGDSSGDSRSGTEPPAPNVVPMTERIAFLRSTYTEDHPQ